MLSRIALNMMPLLACLMAPLPESLGQAPNNDTCDLALLNSVVLAQGLNTGFTNAGSTSSGVNPTCAGNPPLLPLAVATDVWFVYTSSSACSVTFDLGGSNLQFPIVAIYDGNGYAAGSCGSIPEIGCDASLTPLTVTPNAGDVLFIQVFTPIPGDVGAISIDVQSTFALNMTSPIGAGSLQVENSCGAPFSNYVTVFTPVPGAFPNGWFFGIDISFPDLITQASLGAPFSGTLDAGGRSTWTALSGIPSGISIYAVTLQVSPTGLPLSASAPTLYLTP